MSNTEWPMPNNKRAYPFNLGTTSFIFPADYVGNVSLLGPYLDEIELLMFESAEDSLVSEHEIEKLGQLKQKHDLTYNVHLPTDVALTDPDPAMRNQAVKAIRHVMELTSPLSPSTYTLHLHYDEDSREKADVEKWQDITCKTMEQLLSSGKTDSSQISVETLDYPFDWVEKTIREFDLSVCIDIGHLILYGFDVRAVFDKYADITSIIHLHGVENGQDHIALDRLSETDTDRVMDVLKQFTGTVSLEVFSYKDLNPSLEFLQERWQNHQGGPHT